MKVLVVDDNKNDRMFLSEVLLTNGYEVKEAENGVDALGQLEKETPDLIISDILMPQMDGFMLIKKLHEDKRTGSIPFVFFTGTYLSKEDRDFGLSLGASRFLVKPLDMEEFLTEVEAVIKEHKTGKTRQPVAALNKEEYLEKYSTRLSLKLEYEVKMLEEEIEKRKSAENLFNLMAKNIKDVFWISTPDLSRFEFISPAFEHIWEHTTGELYRNPNLWYEVIHPQDRDKVRCVLNRSAEKESSSIIHFRLARPDGAINWIEARIYPVIENPGKVLRIAGVAHDITKRKNTEELLQQSEEKYRTLYESSSDAIMLFDETGIFDCNKAALKIFDFSKKEDLMKVHLAELSPMYQPDGVDSIASSINKIMKAFREGTNRFEWVHRKKNGEDFHADVLLNAFHLKEKQAMQATVRDITEKKQAEMLRIEKERLEYANIAKSEFLASMSHELRTPLNSIIGFSQLLDAGIAGEITETQKRYVENITNSGNFLLNLINDILDLSKVEAGKIELYLENISLATTIEETITLVIEKILKQGLAIEKEFDPQIDEIVADKQRVKQVMFNLLSNAIKFSRKTGGTITIITTKMDENAQISVSDTGIGIKPENIGKVFHKFERLDKEISQEYEGTGLGLAISKQLVELHRGRIWVESVYGKGTTFTFMLPIESKRMS